MSKKDWLKSVLVYLCITFFIITLVFIYMSLRGKPQAGLIEVSCSATLFVIFLYVIKKVLPQAESIISTILFILIAVLFVSANYFLQIKENKDYTTKQILIGDLLAKKFIKEEDKDSYKLPDKSLRAKIGKNEFSKTTTEKYTIESPLEKPQKMNISDEPTKLTLDNPLKPHTKNVQTYKVDIPVDNIPYKIKLKDNEMLTTIIEAVEIIEKPEGLIYEKSFANQFYKSVDTPLEIRGVNMSASFSKKEGIFLQRTEVNTKIGGETGYFIPPTSNLIKDTFEKP